MSESTSVSEDLGDGSEVAPVADTPEAPISIRETAEAAYDAAQSDTPPGPGHNGGPEMEPEPSAETVGRHRSPDGKFAAKPEEAPAETAPTDIPAPEGWGDKAKVDWNRLPASVRAEIASRTAPQADPVRAVLNEFHADIAAVGAQPEQMVRNLLGAHRLLSSNPDHGFGELARMYGFDLNRLAPQQAAAQPSEAGVPVDPQVKALRDEIATLRSQVSETRQLTAAQQQSALERQQAETAQEITGFAKDRPHFEAVRQDMALLIQHGRAPDLATAYDMAVWAHPQTRAALLQEQRTAEEATRAKEAAARTAAARRAGQINVRSTPGSVPSAPTSIRETAASVYDAINGAA